ncbi:hypothetical protein D0T49_01280 [Paludibacter sp. 221]|uniref:hypothetical protein n=1 Tax=Paludibacter sp. 221 TaxID=2302939 RepID=UPI0013D2D557|nr:hypothetical protein [Paludibacter sp. 221]NDV45681.1 hypothetical protein [Paludibacter sp. 221]
MKELKTLFLAVSIIALVLFVALDLLFDSVFARPINFMDTLLTGVVIALIVALALVLVINSLLKPKLNFLNTEDTDIPPFGDKMERYIPVETSDFSFEVVKYRIKEQYHITVYDDVEKYVVKFRSGFFPSWGVGGCVTYDAVQRTMKLTCFPITAYTEKSVKVTQTTMDKVEKLIKI